MELRGGGGGGGGGGGRRRGGALSKEALLCWVLFSLLFSVYALFTRHDHVHLLDLRSFRTNSYAHQRRLFNRRELSAGPGSYPPRCAAKCGDCTPCSPVHVPVPPGTPVIAEYYPEAWRCKCGNKLYMP